MLQTGLGSGGGGGHRDGPNCLHPFQPPTRAPGPLTLVTSGSSTPAKVIDSLERAGGSLFLWPSSQEVLGLSPASYVVSVL